MKIGDRFWYTSRISAVVSCKIANCDWFRYHSPYSTLRHAERRFEEMKHNKRIMGWKVDDDELIHIYRTEVTEISGNGITGVIIGKYTFKEFVRYCKVLSL